MAKRSKKTKGVPRGVSPPQSVLKPSLPGPNSRTLLSAIWLPILSAAVVFFVYWSSLKSDFVYDGRSEILQEGFITSLSNLPAVLLFKVLGMNLILGDRPGHLLYLMLIAAVSGKEPFGYHLCGNLLHAANVALLFFLFLRLIATEMTSMGPGDLRRAQLSAVALTLIFGLHPIAVESVSAINYSSDLLITFFTLLGLLAAIYFRPENLRSAIITGTLGTLCAFAAVTCKESGMTTTLIIIVYWFLFRRHEAKGPWFWFLGAATAATTGFLTARFLLAPIAPAHLSYLGGSLSEVFLIQPRLWVFMMGKLAWPMHFSADYTLENVDGLSTSMALLILGIVIVLQAWLAYKSRIGALGVALYWLGLVTVSNFIPLYRILADRFYYLPLAGVAMQLLAFLLMTLRSRARFWLAMAPCLIALVPLTLLTLRREEVFADEFSLWSDTLLVSPSSATAHNNFGAALALRGQIDEAMAQYRNALKIKPDFAAAYYNLGSILLQKGQLDTAIIQLQNALTNNPKYFPAYNNLGEAFSLKGQVDSAIAQYQKALEINPNYAVARNNLGNAFLEKGQIDMAIIQFQNALTSDPGYADACNGLGNAFLQKGQMDAAIAEYQKAVDIKPNDAGAHDNFGSALLQKGQIDIAIVQFQKALTINPNYAEAHDNLGNALLQKGQVDAAIAQHQIALDIKPDYADAHYNLGNALSQKGQVDMAIVQYQKALTINPNYVEAHINLGDNLFQEGKVDQAMIQYQKALDIKPDDAEAHNNLGSALARAGQLDKAIVQFQDALAINPNYAEAQKNLAIARAMVRSR